MNRLPPPDYIVWRRRRNWGGWLAAAVGALGLVTGLAIGLNVLLSIVLGFVAAGIVSAARRR